jgi:exopolysaccharide biosynthesis WecB/TagA/CpsF family protein
MTRAGKGWKLRWTRVVEAMRVVHSASEELALLRQLAAGGDSRVLGFINAHAMNSIAGDAEFFDALMDADLLLRDGSGMALLYRRCGRDGGLNMNGTDLIPKILAVFRGRRVAFWGTDNSRLQAAAARCSAEFGVQIVSQENGFHEIGHYRQLAAELQPDLIVLGMGMPKQERVARAIKGAMRAPSLIVCGGAIIDFLSGKVPRAPAWMRALGVEWLYRLLREPRRLFKRYVIGNPLFLCRIRAWGRHVS